MTHHTPTERWLSVDTKTYRFKAAELDVLPLDTFVIETELGTGYPDKVAHIARPNHPENYSQPYLTPGNRLLYVCWQNGLAIRRLRTISNVMTARYLVQPDDPGHDLLVAFKMACDMRRGWSDGAVPHPPGVLLRALGLVDTTNAAIRVT